VIFGERQVDCTSSFTNGPFRLAWKKNREKDLGSRERKRIIPSAKI
jgi:hypothetical protein